MLVKCHGMKVTSAVVKSGCMFISMQCSKCTNKSLQAAWVFPIIGTLFYSFDVCCIFRCKNSLKRTYLLHVHLLVAFLWECQQPMY